MCEKNIHTEKLDIYFTKKVFDGILRRADRLNMTPAEYVHDLAVEGLLRYYAVRQDVELGLHWEAQLINPKETKQENRSKWNL